MLRTNEGEMPPAARGREQDWLAIRCCVTSAGADALLLTGEVGIGKSMMWSLGVGQARAAGARVLEATPVEGEVDMPYVVLGDLLSTVAAEALPQLPELQRQALEVVLLQRDPASSPPSSQLIATAVLAVLRWCAGQAPVVIAVDDLHWIDSATQDVLTYVARRLADVPIRWLLSVRTALLCADPVCSPHDDIPVLSALPGLRKVAITPLSPGRISEVIEERLGVKHSRADIEAIAASTRGNPFLAMEFGAELAHAQRAPGDPLPVPPSLRELVACRLEALSPEAIQVLCVVSALGRPAVAVVVHALEPLIPDPLRAVDSAVLKGAVTEVGGRLVVAHPLLSAAGIEALPPFQRTVLHTRLAETAESPVARARHLALASTEADPWSAKAAVADALDAAVEGERGTGGLACVVELAERALHFTRPGDTAAAVRRRITAAQLCAGAARFERVLELLEPLDLAELDTASLEDVLPVLAWVTMLLHGEEAALAAVRRGERDGSPDPRRTVLLLALSASWVHGDSVRRHDHARAAVALVRQANLQGLGAHRAYLELIDSRTDSGHGVDLDAVAQAERLETGELRDRLAHSARVSSSYARALMANDDFATAEAVLAKCLEEAQAHGQDLAKEWFSVMLANLLLLSGRMPEALHVIEEGERVTGWDEIATGMWVYVKGEVLRAQGKIDELAELATRSDWLESPVRHHRVVAHYQLGVIAAERGDHLAAVEWLATARQDAEALGVHETGSRYRLDGDLGEQMVLAEQFDDAAAVAEELLAAGERANRCTLRGIGRRIQGLRAAALGDLDRARELLAAAVAEHESTPLRPQLGLSLLELGRVERRRRARRKARICLERAVTLFTECGLRSWVERAQQELDRIGGARAAGGLTTSEHRVVELVVSGATNKEAASTLYVGVRTVETHLAAVYRKLGLNSRRELIRLLQDTAAYRGALRALPSR